VRFELERLHQIERLAIALSKDVLLEGAAISLADAKKILKLASEE